MAFFARGVERRAESGRGRHSAGRGSEEPGTWTRPWRERGYAWRCRRGRCAMLLMHKGIRCGSSHVIACGGGWSTKLLWARGPYNIRWRAGGVGLGRLGWGKSCALAPSRAWTVEGHETSPECRDLWRLWLRVRCARLEVVGKCGGRAQSSAQSALPLGLGFENVPSNRNVASWAAKATPHRRPSTPIQPRGARAVRTYASRHLSRHRNMRTVHTAESESSSLE
jgi:hypothetical protein